MSTAKQKNDLVKMNLVEERSRTKLQSNLRPLFLVQANSPCIVALQLRAIACKYGESDDRSENSDFLLLRQKDPFGELLSEISFKLPTSSRFCEI